MNPLALLPMLKTLLLNPWTYVGLLVVLLGVQSSRLSGAKQDVAEQKRAVVTLKSDLDAMDVANKHWQQTADDLQVRIRTMVQERQVQADQVAKTLADRDAKIEVVTAAANREKIKRAELWKATQSCDGLGSLRIDTACAPMADRLRERTTQH